VHRVSAAPEHESSDCIVEENVVIEQQNILVGFPGPIFGTDDAVSLEIDKSVRRHLCSKRGAQNAKRLRVDHFRRNGRQGYFACVMLTIVATNAMAPITVKQLRLCVDCAQSRSRNASVEQSGEKMQVEDVSQQITQFV
jgi:hypothetical protein